MIIGIQVAVESVGLQIFDYLYAFDQYRNAENNYKSRLTIKHSIDGSEDVKILFVYMSRNLTIYDVSKYDLVILCNGSEPVGACRPGMIDACTTNSNVYLLSNSLVDPQHPLANKIIRYTQDIPLCHDYWTRPFYPQFYDRNDQSRMGGVFVVNGENRANRHHAIELIKAAAPTVSVKSSIGAKITTTESAYLSAEDRIFCEFVNSRYTASRSVNWYYGNKVYVGVDKKFGSIPPGYFLIDEYYNNKVIVFPETSWTNNELSITEKSLKCFMAQCLPMPIAGANVNKLYNNLGYNTAWNLLPEELQAFDAELDHATRYQGLASAVAWLHDNSQTFESEDYKQMVQQNHTNFLKGDSGTDLEFLAKILGLNYD